MPIYISIYSLIAQLVKNLPARDPSLIPGLGRSPGEGMFYPLQCSWASLVAQLVKNLPARREIWVRSLGWEDPLEKEKATPSSFLAWRTPWTIHGVAESDTTERLSLSLHIYFLSIYRFPGGSVVKNPQAKAGDAGSVIGLGRSSGGGNGNPLQESCLRNPMDRRVWWAVVHTIVAKESGVT